MTKILKNKAMFLQNKVHQVLYPKAVYFVLLHQIFERFSYWGITVILPFFLQIVLKFNDDTSTAIYHGFSVFNYLSSIIGAIVADSYFGKYKTIMLFSGVYLLGTSLITVSATEILTSGATLTCTIAGLALTGLAAGSIKPCITAFGGDQFQLPEQERQLQSYFPLLYLMVNISLLMASLIMPVLRRDVSCFGESRCYSVALVVPCALILMATVMLWTGQRYYKHITVNENVVAKAGKCIKLAIVNKYRSNSEHTKSHWLDYAGDKYDNMFIQNMKVVLSIVILFIPVSVFWAIYEQQFSRWAFQAARMNGDIGLFTMAPDQVATLNFILTIMFIPLFEKVVYPCLEWCRILTKPMHRVVCGFAFSTLAIVVSGILQLQIENSNPNSVHMIWLLPQYVLMSIAEVLLIPSINRFAYSQAPESMKSILLMATLIPPAFGGIIVIIVAKVNLFQHQSTEFFFFSGVNICAILLLIFLVRRYQQVKPEDESYDELKGSRRETNTSNASSTEISCEGISHQGFVNVSRVNYC